MANANDLLASIYAVDQTKKTALKRFDIILELIKDIQVSTQTSSSPPRPRQLENLSFFLSKQERSRALFGRYFYFTKLGRETHSFVSSRQLLQADSPVVPCLNPR